MRYIGSKLRLTNFIEKVVKEHCGDDLSGKVFCDLFAGTGVVGRHFCPMVKKVIANDFEKYSYVSNYVGLRGFDEDIVQSFLDTLNGIEGTTESSLYQCYAEGGNAGRLYFNKENGKKLAEARLRLASNKTLSRKNYMAVLLSIIDGADKVANTMSTYGAYAKKLKSNSEKEIFFALPKQAEKASYLNDVWMCDSNELIKGISGDILYLDPPYNNRQYGSNYHVLNAIAIGEAPETDSVTGVRKDDYNKSDYCREKTVGKALDELISNAKFEWIFLSYNNEGLLSFDEIKSIMSKYGDYSVEGTEYQRYKADSNRKQAANGVVEYIHILHKGVFTEKETPEEDPYRSMAEDMQIPEEVPVHHITLKTKIKLNPISTVITRETVDKEFEEYVENFHVKPDVKLESIPINFTVKKDGVEIWDIEDKMVVSPMNYMGGKKKLIKTLKEYFPKDVDVFVDLFCGGATVGINANAKTVVFNDNLKPLIWMYTYMCNHSVEDCLSYIDSTIAKYGLVQGKEGEANYYNFRDNHYNALPVEERHPLDLFVLMAYSFNNQIRFNLKKNWKFNIPFGANRSSFNSKMRENLIGFINALHEKDCVFSEQDFRDFPYFPNMFVYADPPYLISQATYNDDWNENSENLLLKKLKYWDSRGVKFALSNVLENKGKTNEILKNWVEENGYKIIHLDKSYANSYYHRKERESKTDEVLIVNY